MNEAFVVNEFEALCNLLETIANASRRAIGIVIVGEQLLRFQYQHQRSLSARHDDSIALSVKAKVAKELLGAIAPASLFGALLLVMLGARVQHPNDVRAVAQLGVRGLLLELELTCYQLKHNLCVLIEDILRLNDKGSRTNFDSFS